MPKPNRNDCKNGKQIDLLVKGARSSVQQTQKFSKQQNLNKTSE